MEKIGSQKIWSYFDNETEACAASNKAIRGGRGHLVGSYFELAMKVAELQFFNRDHVFVFRGQQRDYRTTRNNSMLKASIFRNQGKRVPSESVLGKRFDRLQKAEDALVEGYTSRRFKGFERVKRHRVIRWAILQHYEVCATPLLDVTHSLRIAASFASNQNNTEEAFVFAFGMPNLSGAVTASSEAGLQIIRLSSACPPDAVRPHIQEGYLVGEYPEIADLRQKAQYKIYEMDFGRRLLAKFRFNPSTFWQSENYLPLNDNALYPANHRDQLLSITEEIKESISRETA